MESKLQCGLVAVYYEGQSCNQKNGITLELNKKKLPIYLVSAYNKVYMGYLHNIFVVGSVENCVPF